MKDYYETDEDVEDRIFVHEKGSRYLTYIRHISCVTEKRIIIIIIIFPNSINK